MEITNSNFKQKFKSNCFDSNYFLLNTLLEIIQNPDDKYLHSVLNLYYKTYPEIIFDIEFIEKTLKFQFSIMSCFILDFNELFWGGYEPNQYIFENLNLDNNQAIISNQNWSQFILESKLSYWSNPEKIESFKQVMNIHFFEDRLPKSPREKMLALNRKFIINGEVKEINYKYFEVKNVMNYYTQLIEIFFPNFKLLKSISNNKIKRYAKNLGNGYFISLYFDFAFLESELKKTDLELPHIKVEFFSETLKSHIKEDYYLISQKEFPIIRISLAPFIGNPDNFRIGNSSHNEIDLKKNLFYYFDIYSVYLNTYLDFAEINFKKTLSNW